MSDTEDGVEVTADLASGRVDLAFPARDAVREFFRAAVEQGGFMIPLAARPQPFATLDLTARDGTGFELEFRARVVQMSDRGGALTVAFLLADWNEAKDRELERKLRVEAAGPGAADGPADEARFDAASPVFRIKQLDPSKRMILAMKGDRAERQILSRDISPQVLLGLLANPRIETEEVLAIVKSTHVSAAVLQRVAGERRWMSSPEIRTAVVRNPKTPTPLAIRLLDTLPLGDLRDMAKMGSLREDLRRAAFRVYTKMTSQR